MRWLTGDVYYDRWPLRAWFAIFIMLLDWFVIHAWRPFQDWRFIRDVRKRKHS